MCDLICPVYKNNIVQTRMVNQQMQCLTDLKPRPAGSEYRPGQYFLTVLRSLFQNPLLARADCVYVCMDLQGFCVFLFIRGSVTSTILDQELITSHVLPQTNPHFKTFQVRSSMYRKVVDTAQVRKSYTRTGISSQQPKFLP